MSGMVYLVVQRASGEIDVEGRPDATRDFYIEDGILYLVNGEGDEEKVECVWAAGAWESFDVLSEDELNQAYDVEWDYETVSQ